MTDKPEPQALQANPTRPKYPDKGIGRPTSYSPATAELIASRLADGELLTDICKTPGMPARQTVHQWRMRMPAFDDLYLRARAIGMESMSDDTMLIADDDTNDILSDGTPNPTNVNRARLQVHARHFLMGKLARSTYGERVDVKHSGQVDHTVTLSDKERMRRLAFLLAEDKRSGALIEGTASDSLTEPDSVAGMPANPDLTECRSDDEL